MKNNCCIVFAMLLGLIHGQAFATAENSESASVPTGKFDSTSAECAQSFPGHDRGISVLTSPSFVALKEERAKRSNELRQVVLRQYSKELAEMFDNGSQTVRNFSDLHFVEAKVGPIPSGKFLNLILAFKIPAEKDVETLGIVKYFHAVKDDAPSRIQIESLAPVNSWKFWRESTPRVEVVTIPSFGDFNSILGIPSLFNVDASYHTIQLPSEAMIRAVPVFVHKKAILVWRFSYHHSTGSAIVDHLLNEGEPYVSSIDN